MLSLADDDFRVKKKRIRAVIFLLLLQRCIFLLRHFPIVYVMVFPQDVIRAVNDERMAVIYSDLQTLIIMYLQGYFWDQSCFNPVLFQIVSIFGNGCHGHKRTSGSVHNCH